MTAPNEYGTGGTGPRSGSLELTGRTRPGTQNGTEWPLVEEQPSALRAALTGNLPRAATRTPVPQRPRFIATPQRSTAPAQRATTTPAAPATRMPSHDERATEFDGDRFLLPEKLPPQTGWRRAMWRVSGGRVTPKPSAAEIRTRTSVTRIQTRTNTCQRVAIASAKGGVGKTTAALLLGTAMAMHRLDRVIAIDANPDAGSLGWRVDRETQATLTDVLRHAARIERYSDMRALTNQAPSRLEILASELDPAVSQALGEAEYATVIDVLERYYSVILCDLGTGLLDSATQGLIKMAGQLVVVAAPSIDAGRVANFTLDFIERRHPDKCNNAVVLINNVRNDGLVDVKAMKKHFKSRVASVVTIPYDRHLANGAAPNWALLRPATQEAYLEAAAAIADGFGKP